MGAFSEWYVMKYGETHKVVNFSKQSMAIVNNAIAATNFKWNQGELDNSRNKSRQSQVAWVKDAKMYSMLLGMCKQINSQVGWNLNITGIEPVQFGAYSESDYYNWHVDQHQKPNKGLVRKVSMSLGLNDDYEGGDFDLEIYKPGTDPRYITVPLPKGSAIFFQGDQWHRVNPVTSGMRKSLVAWFYGPPYT